MFIDFYTETEKEGRIRTILPISQIKNIRVFNDDMVWLEVEDMTYSFEGKLGNKLIETLSKQGLMLTVDQPSEPMPPVGEPLREIVGGAFQEFMNTKGRTD
jgi:hypothetical protein